MSSQHFKVPDSMIFSALKENRISADYAVFKAVDLQTFMPSVSNARRHVRVPCSAQGITPESCLGAVSLHGV